MSISAISPTNQTLGIQSVTSAAQPSTAGSAGSASGVNVDISKPGQLLSELDSLAQSDPDKFKAVTADIATQLKNAAATQTGSSADLLNKLADRFSSASQSGTASALTPPSAGKAHGHHHGHGGHHKTAAVDATGQDATGAGADGTIAQTVQGIISTALNATAATATSGSSASQG
jgi:hypothetical protein